MVITGSMLSNVDSQDCRMIDVEGEKFENVQFWRGPTRQLSFNNDAVLLGYYQSPATHFHRVLHSTAVFKSAPAVHL